MVQKMLEDLELAKAIAMPYAIHLPVYLSEQWQTNHDFYDAYYLDPSEELRDRTFEMLRERLSKNYSPMYYVIHFPGIYDKADYEGVAFQPLLDEALMRFSDLAQTYNCQIALEYLGTNEMFSDYSAWLEAVKPYKRVNILLDTGHLYFGCYKRGYCYEEVLAGLAPHCIGFHLWNVHGEGYYDKSEFYQKYRHVVPRNEQSRELGWAFDPKVVIPYLAQFNKPMLVEAGQRYQGEAYFLEGLIQIREMLRNNT
jgi:sugar phosphate isomerase/epimerase